MPATERELFEQTPDGEPLRLVETCDFARGRILLEWERAKKRAAHAEIFCEGGRVVCDLHQPGAREVLRCAPQGNAVHAMVRKLEKRLPVEGKDIRFRGRRPVNEAPGQFELVDRPVGFACWRIIAWDIIEMARQLIPKREPPVDRILGALAKEMAPGIARVLERDERRCRKERAQRDAIAARIEAAKRKREARESEKARVREEKMAAEVVAPRPVAPVRPVPDAPLRMEQWHWPELSLGLNGGGNEEALRQFTLLERASLLWVSNQSDDLLCLPYCNLERLEYQIRTALRVIGALRGRALLSDEVGLGKTIEAGLVLKEYLTRGMARRFLVLTMPSLVDQWQEELENRFGLATVTTNSPGWRADPAAFWQENDAVIASLHTLKQEAHLAHARQRPWDVLIVDEAHHLRNQSSKAWQAVSSLPRQFMLLLTATPVQNSLEEMYNLVTLLRPGQLPPPKEFSRRFIDPKQPRRPREPEELRRLLGQVMIRNTRANAGIKLPSRRAETVLFDLSEPARERLRTWEEEFRTRLDLLPPQQSSMWGRLLLQCAGSSPAAWASALESFPDEPWRRRWLEGEPVAANWEKKIAALHPLADHEGGVVVFTQFIATQEALAESLRQAGVRAWLVNGQVPAAERQPITEAFRREGGVLLLTRSGAEGRNLQFCHQLVNFDLPWNPMEIEQRIGRLHRIGQERVVRIYNFVETGTLQAHLLDILQEKLNLFELVVGETGLILGERFGSDDFSEEIFRCWRERGDNVGKAMEELGEGLAAARSGYDEVKELDETLFAADYETA